MITYTIHPTLTLNVHTPSRRYLAYFKNEYERVSGFAPRKNNTVVNVHIVKKLPRQQRGDRHRQLKFKKILNYEYIVRGLETNTVTIYFKDTWSGKLYAKNVTLFLQAQVLEPIVYYKFLEHNILFMHAAGVSDGTHGYIFPAYGGTGKTTLTLGLMGEGMQVLGDDLLIVEPNKQLVYPYLRPLHIFTYNVQTLRGATIPYSIRTIVRFKDILRLILEKITRQEFLISTRVHAETLYANFTPSPTVTYRKICFLKKSGKHEMVTIKKSDVERLAQEILESEDLNDSLYNNILKPAEKNAVIQQELAVIKNVLQNIAAFEYINTRLLDFRDLKDFKENLVA